MHIFREIVLALTAASVVLAAPAPEAGAVGKAAAKYCDATTTICYSEYTSPASVVYRIAIPDTATASAPFDVLLQLVSPKTLGWAGVAWGGQMANDPLTVSWANGASSVVSSRRATGHTLPAAYAGATYTVLPGSLTNSTHWTLNVLCSGCSQWADQTGKAVALNPASTAVSLAYASSARAVTDPTNNASTFSIHNSVGKWTQDLSSAKLANFTALVQAFASTTKAAGLV